MVEWSGDGGSIRGPRCDERLSRVAGRRVPRWEEQGFRVHFDVLTADGRPREREARRRAEGGREEERGGRRRREQDEQEKEGGREDEEGGLFTGGGRGNEAKAHSEGHCLDLSSTRRTEVAQKKDRKMRRGERRWSQRFIFIGPLFIRNAE